MEIFYYLKGQVHVNIGGSECVVQNTSLTEIKCILGANSAGIYPINLNIDSKGLANMNVNFEYKLNIHSLSNQESNELILL